MAHIDWAVLCDLAFMDQKRSAEEMGLKAGDAVTAVVKATEVMIAKP